jgi:type VI secretion system protein VasD
MAATTLLLAGCSRTPKLPPPPPVKPPPSLAVVPERRLQVSLTGGATLNSAVPGRGAPVVVRVYLLKSPVTFEAAGFMNLFRNDQATLADTVISRDELLLVPGGRETLSRELPEGARALAVFAAFREPDRALWRSVVALPPAPAPTTTPPREPIVVAIEVQADGRRVQAQLR